MKKRNPRPKKQKNIEKNDKQSNTGERRYLPQITVAWGRAGSVYRPGLFTKQYFEKHGEACAAHIYSALTEEIERLNRERVDIGEKPLRRPNYSSFNRYMHWFLILGLIKRTDRREPAIYDFLQEKQFYKLTAKGVSEEAAWLDPIRAVHPEFR